MQSEVERTGQELIKLSEALLLCQRELAQVHEDQEPLEEKVCHQQQELDQLRGMADQLAMALAEQSARLWWEERQPSQPIGLRRFLTSRLRWMKKAGDHRRQDAFGAQVRLLEDCPLMDAPWYLARNADVAASGIPAAVHYLQTGAAEARDPGPDFSTAEYLAEHPEIAGRDVNPLVHHIESQAAEP